METFELSHQESNGTVTVVMRGELDIAHVDSVERQLTNLEQGKEELVLDLRQLKFLDSMGLRLILRADARAREAGRKMKIVKGPEQVQRVFRLTRMDERLEIVDG